jgi:hypothetical protein
LYKNKIQIFVIIVFAAVVIPSAYGHGLGFDTISDVDAGGKEVTITVELPMEFNYDDDNNKQIIITTVEDETKKNAKNVTLLVGLFHEGTMLFRELFFAPDGILSINVDSDMEYTDDMQIEISGMQDSLSGAWHSTQSQPLAITGPIFNSGGLYNFEIEIKTIDDQTNIIEGNKMYNADISIAETTSYLQSDLNDNDVQFRLKSYFDEPSTLNYDPQTSIITFEMPFDWSTSTISHIPVVHMEVHFPKEFTELLQYPSYVGSINGITLFKSSVNVDDYTEKSERIVHFVLLNDQLKYLKNQLKKSDQEIPDKMIFKLLPSDEITFPISVMTRDEQFQVDLSWDPIDITPNNLTNFIFTIRDGETGEPLRHSSYNFVILQEGEEIHRSESTAVVGGSFETFTFSESQTGHTTIRFEDIRDSGMDTEFNVVIVPEFGSMAIVALVAGVTISLVFFGVRGRSSLVFLFR